jgi:hypothetical protein
MDKKHPNQQESEGLKGFEEIIEGQRNETSFLQKQPRKEVSFLTNDTARLTKLKDLFMDKIPLAAKYEQGEKLIHHQQDEVQLLKKHLFEHCQKIDSSYRQSLTEIFDAFFSPAKD